MHLTGAIILAAVIGALAFGYLGRVSARVADHGTPGAQRVARGGRRAAGQGRKAAQRGVAEIWAEVRAADWLERRRIARERRASRPGTAATAGRGIVTTARAAGRAARATGRGSARGLRAARSWLPSVVIETPGQPSAPAVAPPAPAVRPPAVSPDMRPAERGPVPVTTDTTPNGASPGTAPGGGADLFTAIQQVTGHAMSGGLRSKQRSFKVLEDSFDYMSQQLQAFARQLAEPGQEYPASIWEPLAKAAAHLKAASSAAGESSSGIGALASMPLGEAADSPVHVPHNTQLNAPR